MGTTNHGCCVNYYALHIEELQQSVPTLGFLFVSVYRILYKMR